jgi:hypothetical protein
VRITNKGEIPIRNGSLIVFTGPCPVHALIRNGKFCEWRDHETTRVSITRGFSGDHHQTHGQNHLETLTHGMI